MVLNTPNSRVITRLLPAVLMLTALLVGFAPRPAVADGAASTRNIILGAAAVAAGIIIYNNVQHKHLQHNTVVGYTRDGGTVYADGHVAYPNGNVLYVGNRNGQRCGYVGGYQRCDAQPIAYYPRADDDYGRGRHRGWGKHWRHHGGGDDRYRNRHADEGDGDR